MINSPFVQILTNMGILDNFKNTFNCKYSDINVLVNNSIKKFCATRHFLTGLGVSLALLAVTIPMIMPLITVNAEGVQTNAIDIAQIKSDVGHFDKSLVKLDASIANLDDRIVKLDKMHYKLNLILCNITSDDNC